MSSTDANADALGAAPEENSSQPPKGKRKHSSETLKRYDSLDIESRKLRDRGSKVVTWSMIMHLAFQSIGVVYGDIGTSPLYVYSSTFTSGIKHNDDILGVLSLILYTLTLIPVLKYVFIVLQANDNGDGGTFAMYSLICRYAKVGLIPNQEAEDGDVSNYQLELSNNRVLRASKLKSTLENSQFAKYVLLFATMLGTSMVIGDGILTPSISVLSAVGGITEATPTMTQGSSRVSTVIFQTWKNKKERKTLTPLGPSQNSLSTMDIQNCNKKLAREAKENYCDH
ncbi:high affinity potassium transporter [Sarracenia purpurea var. burkii]